ncbi:hypothetical protein PV379_02740 [Streptomyces caniscabiei]|uniref:hypothetical protein n=1 Tax=Streptomyces caniscabiei TaxID=2746961 RepID=UPI0029AFD985|nr:hypothetical protein [Streptomyces caniscabiei]MDX2776268.1 hypothetical protein [Streptomyces caniscabiei]
MQYEFSVGSFFVGLLILAAGIAFVKWHQVIADNFGSGVASYDRYKLWAFITCSVGLVVMLNLHTMLLTWFFSLIIPN